MKCGIVVFPGSNCDRDSFHILKEILGLETEWIWHKENSLKKFDLIVLPGGFSYGDYLRPGAIAKFSPIMKSIMEYAENGGKLLGICNGFQTLLECGLLPGVLMRNISHAFICDTVPVRLENDQTPFTSQSSKGTVLKLPIAHADGRYFADEDTLKELEDNDQVVLRYCDSSGMVANENNPNGSLTNIAGIVNKAKTICGMMPHPERQADPAWPNIDGQVIFRSLIQSS
jgi:phosphoribosylformylglycinamidine synthase subunit PurQ / glutaminase